MQSLWGLKFQSMNFAGETIHSVTSSQQILYSKARSDRGGIRNRGKYTCNKENFTYMGFRGKDMKALIPYWAVGSINFYLQNVTSTI